VIAPSFSLPATRAGTRWNLRYCIKIAFLWLCFCALAGAGIGVRRWVWNNSANMRFKLDIDNGFQRGMEVNQDQRTDFTRAPYWGDFFVGYRGLYEKEYSHPTGWMKFDYSPLRLMVMSLWVRGILAVDPGAGGWAPTDVWPLLWFNTLCAFVSAIGVYVLVKVWLRRSAAMNEGRYPRAIELRSWIAGACLWFNPAILLDAHVWPQWDVWCLPFYVWAIFAGTCGAWFWAGVLIAIGAMLKGQILIVAPGMIVWAIFSGGIRQTALAILGLLTFAVMTGSFWLLPNTSAWAAAVIFVVLLTLVGLLLSRRLRGFWLYYVAALLCVGLLASSWYFGGSWLWLQTSFAGAAENFHTMHIDAINFAGTLAERWGWQIDDPLFTVGTHIVTMNFFLRSVYIVLMLLCGVAAALQSSRRSPRVLIALIAPWILMYAILPQMHERYLMWGASLAAIGVGLNLELAILFLLTVSIACASILVVIYHGYGAQFIDRLDPDIGWVVLLVALAYFYQGWKRDRIYVSIARAEHI
jgi:hypothetical protein